MPDLARAADDSASCVTVRAPAIDACSCRPLHPSLRVAPEQPRGFEPGTAEASAPISARSQRQAAWQSAKGGRCVATTSSGYWRALSCIRDGNTALSPLLEG